MKERFGKRLRMARKMAGLSMDGLVEKMEQKVSKNAISKYERGLMIPEQETVSALAQELGVKPEYFFRPFKVEVGEVAFRKTPKLSKDEQNRLKGVTADRLERYLELEELLGIPNEFENPLGNRQCGTFEEVKKAANDLRKEWKLGSNPIPNVLEMLEDAGIKVIEFEDSEDFDALSTYVQEKIPVIVLNKRFNRVRKRLTALHELAHLLLNFPSSISHHRTEQFCNAFASEMLIPEEALIQELGKKRSHLIIPELKDLKEYYGISIQALIYRADKARIIPHRVAKKFWERRDQNEALRVENPKEGYGAYPWEERAYRFMHLIWRAASEEVVSMSKAANLAGMKLSAFRKEFLAL